MSDRPLDLEPLDPDRRQRHPRIARHVQAVVERAPAATRSVDHSRLIVRTTITGALLAAGVAAVAVLRADDPGGSAAPAADYLPALLSGAMPGPDVLLLLDGQLP